MVHQHVYDAQGKRLCCDREEATEAITNTQNTLKAHEHDHAHDHAHHDHAHGDTAAWQPYFPAIVSLIMLLLGIALDNYIQQNFFKAYIRWTWYAVAYLPVGVPVIKEAFESIRKGSFFTEFSLMVLATFGAFAIGEYPEGVAVMLFYAIGELFQNAAVRRAKSNIKALLDIRPDFANVLRADSFQPVNPETVAIGEVIQVRAGEKVPLDGELLSEKSSFNTAALTGESTPKTIIRGETVLAGMVNADKVIELKVLRKFKDSSLARILEMVQNATARKAKTELLIRKFAEVYTPIVFFLALALVAIPYVVVHNYVFSDWLYRALVFLVISCPCALVISIPLGYFGGIGAASRHGILFKGANFLELMTQVNTVVLDKTGTLTEGVFNVQEVVSAGMDKTELLKIMAAIERQSTHPIAKAVVDFTKNELNPYQATEVVEIPGFGLQGIINGKVVLVGNTSLLKIFDIAYDQEIENIVESTVVISIDNQYVGYIIVADKIKTDAAIAVQQLRRNGIKQVMMLSGDKDSITQKVAQTLGIDIAFGDLLPEEKVQKVEDLKQDKTKVIAFVGDGINDAPVLALSDVGIAMGGMGSDAAIETADVVIQTDQPSRIATAIKIGQATKSIVFQNIFLAIAVKVIVLALGAGGLATMWEAVFADVGVALLAILNAVRIQRMNFN